MNGRMLADGGWWMVVLCLVDVGCCVGWRAGRYQSRQPATGLFGYISECNAEDVVRRHWERDSSPHSYTPRPINHLHPYVAVAPGARRERVGERERAVGSMLTLPQLRRRTTHKHATANVETVPYTPSVSADPIRARRLPLHPIDDCDGDDDDDRDGATLLMATGDRVDARPLLLWLSPRCVTGLVCLGCWDCSCQNKHGRGEAQEAPGSGPHWCVARRARRAWA